MDNDFQPLHPRGTEEVFQALEDNQVALSTMKASRFVKAFEKDVDHWERCLSLILEVIEMVLTVQRHMGWTEHLEACHLTVTNQGETRPFLRMSSALEIMFSSCDNQLRN